ncbi:hypothetical protein ACQ4PT_006729 [Festuca glaucescens]
MAEPHMAIVFVYTPPRELCPVVVHLMSCFPSASLFGLFYLVPLPPRLFFNTSASHHHFISLHPPTPHTRTAKASLYAPPRAFIPSFHPPRRRRAMAGVKSLVLLLLVLLALSVASSASSLAGGDHHMQLHGLLSARGRECRGTVGECGADDDAEGELGSASAESHRRFLQNRGYISYGALRRNQVPCSRRGASYYNCRPGGQANPYHRGCSRITRCRG